MSDNNYIQDILKNPESTTFEFIKELEFEKTAMIICSFLNSEGGNLLIGIGEDKSIYGISKSPSAVMELDAFIAKKIFPVPVFSIEIKTIGHKQVMLISVRKGPDKPYFYDGSIYIRVGSATKGVTKKATPSELSRLLNKSNEKENHWENKKVIEFENDDIDGDELMRCRKEIEKNGRISNLPDDNLALLNKLGVYSNGNFTNAAVVLFAKDPYKFISQVNVRLSVFSKDDHDSNLLYDKLFTDNLFSTLRKVQDFFDLAFGISSSFKNNQWQRADKVSFPRLAVREALLNAFVHRDLSGSLFFRRGRLTGLDQRTDRAL